MTNCWQIVFLIHSSETSRDISKWRFVLMQFFLPRRYFPFTLCIDRDVARMIDSQSVLSIWTDWKSFRKMKNVVKKYHKGTRKNSNQFPTHLTIPDFYLNLTKLISIQEDSDHLIQDSIILVNHYYVIPGRYHSQNHFVTQLGWKDRKWPPSDQPMICCQLHLRWLII